MNEISAVQTLPRLFSDITSDARYIQNLDWGKPSRGHPEGTVRAHIDELELNLDALRPDISSDEFWKLRVLIHVHDSFKAKSSKGVAITDPKSHASLAMSFLKSHCDDPDLLNMVQFHDEPYALWRQARNRGNFNQHRLNSLVDVIEDWNLFLMFTAIDGATAGKSPEPLYWAAKTIASRVGLESQAVGYIDKLAKDLRARNR